MVDTISQPGCAECGAGGLVLTDYRPYAFLQALLQDRVGGRTEQEGYAAFSLLLSTLLDK